jgi:uncharacterized repeat protein (TIGR03806 family)
VPQGPDAGTSPASGLDARPENRSCVAPARPVENTGVTTRPAFAHLRFTEPLLVLQAPGDVSRLFVAQRRGVVRVFPNDEATTSASTFIDITARVLSSAGSEVGLLGMAFHPRFALNGEVFLSYTDFRDRQTRQGLRSVISRFKSTDGGATLDPGSEQVLLTVDQPYSNHNGGGIAFGPDGYLYIGFGDGGSGGDPHNHAQNRDVLLGKFLRIDVDGGVPYAIPPTNPFRNGGGRPEIYAWGFRNPWRWSFDRLTGELWVADVGQREIEEVDRVVLGGNYGWRIKEGTRCYNATTCDGTGLIDPVVQYDHTQGVSITGGFVYRGTAMPSLVGHFVYADFSSGRIWAVGPDVTVPGRYVTRLLMETSFNIASFGERVDGELLLTDFAGGGLHQLVPAGPVLPGSFPAKLSATGCVDPTNPRQVAPGVIPFTVNAPLWSDGADKERFLAVPDGKAIAVGPDGDFDLPEGSVLMKTFLLGGRRVETRLLMRHPGGSWAGYTYEWDDAQTDATLLPASKTKLVGGQPWYFPGRTECLQCHTAAAGFALGPEVGQLNGELAYPGGRTANQLATLAHVGLFSAPLPGAPSTLARYPTAEGPEPLEARAKAYLHANCSGCHRPGGPGRGSMDLRYATPLAQMGVCDAAPEQGNLGFPDARLLKPGHPELSILSLRLHALDADRMPPLGTGVVDPGGVSLVDDWITKLGGCP